MELEYEYILTVCETGSFSKAAEKLQMTQPALSMAIHKAEVRIGRPLFDRKKRPLQLTVAGRIYIAGITQIKHVEEGMQRQIQDLDQLLTGSLSIGGSHYLNARILPPVLSAFNKQYPGIHLHLLESSAAQLAAMLKEQTVDLTFSCDPVFLQQFKRYSVFHDQILLAVPAEDAFNQQYATYTLTAPQILVGKHLEKNCPRLPLASLSQLAFILLKPGNNLHDRVGEFFQEAHIMPQIKLEISQIVTAYHLAAAGLAATFICDRVVGKDSSSLRFYALDAPHTDREFYILRPHTAYMPRAARAFIAFCRKELA